MGSNDTIFEISVSTGSSNSLTRVFLFDCEYSGNGTYYTATVNDENIIGFTTTDSEVTQTTSFTTTQVSETTAASGGSDSDDSDDSAQIGLRFSKLFVLLAALVGARM